MSLIYKIQCNNPNITEIYIGSTKNLNQRKKDHKKACSNEKNKNHNIYVYQFIRNNYNYENWSFIILEYVNQNELNSDHTNLHKRERYWIELLLPKLNLRIPTRSQQEWRDANKSYINECIQSWKILNREKVMLQKRRYREKNKEKIKLKNKEYREKNKEIL
jgi:hypothetical protein